MLTKVANRLRSPIFPAMLLGSLAFVMRLGAINRTITPDEFAWLYRSVQFRRALLSADWANTIQTGHPGVTTTWLGSIGIQIKLWLDPTIRENVTWAENLAWLTNQESTAMQQLAPFLTPARLSVIVLHSLVIGSLFLLLHSRWGAMSSGLATFALAAEPFFMGLSGILHTDALLTSFTLLAISLALWHSSHRAFFFAGCATAFALLSKLPGILLLLFIPLVLLTKYHFIEQKPFIASIKNSIKAGFYWMAGCLGMLMLFLPAIWADPMHLWATLSSSGGQEIALAAPTFFFGVDRFNPSHLFYPVVAIYHLSPLATLTTLASVWFVYKHPHKEERYAVLVVIGFATLFWMGLLVSNRVFDRYILPVNALIVLVGCLLAGQLIQRTNRSAFMLPILFVLGLSFGLLHWRYPMLGFNWFLGGQQVATQVVPSGWGEAASLAARTSANTCEPPLRFANNVTVGVFSTAPVRITNQPSTLEVSETGSVIGLLSDSAEWPTPSTTVTLGSKQYGVWCGYQPKAPYTSQSTDYVRFDNGLQLSQLDVGAIDGTLFMQLGWQVLSPADYAVSISLNDENGTPFATIEQPVVSSSGQPSRHWRVNESNLQRIDLPLADSLPPRNYELRVQVFDSTGNRLGVFDQNAGFRGIFHSIQDVSAAGKGVLQENMADVLVKGWQAVGLNSARETGEQFEVELFLARGSTTLDAVDLHLQLADQTVSVPVDMSLWQLNHGYQIRPKFRIPTNLANQTVTPSLSLTDPNGTDLWDEPLTLAPVQIVAVERNFDLDLATPLGVSVNNFARLQAATVMQDGEQARVTLVWQATAQIAQDLTTFVHIRDAAGQLIAQQDRAPTRPTSRWVPGEVVSDTFIFDIAEFDSVAVGLYAAQTGERQPIFDQNQQPLPDRQYIFSADN